MRFTNILFYLKNKSNQILFVLDKIKIINISVWLSKDRNNISTQNLEIFNPIPSLTNGTYKNKKYFKFT